MMQEPLPTPLVPDADRWDGPKHACSERLARCASGNYERLLRDR